METYGQSAGRSPYAVSETTDLGRAWKPDANREQPLHEALLALLSCRDAPLGQRDGLVPRRQDRRDLALFGERGQRDS